LCARASISTEAIFACSVVGSLAGWLLRFFIDVESVPAVRIGQDRVLPQDAFARMAYPAFRVEPMTARRPCSGHNSRLAGLWYNSLSLHRFPVPMTGVAAYGASL
jgi:hypothetical protein